MATPAPPPRIVFFGPARAGKTGLLHAFLKRTAAPPTDLAPAPADVVPYLAASADQPACVLLDVGGRAAAELITDPSRLMAVRGRIGPAAAAGEVRSADAIVLALDASADPAEVLDLFRRFGAFLDGLKDSREFGREVGGLPVFLTLTKCDTLFRPGDDPVEWQVRVQAKADEARHRFEDYLAEETAFTADPLAFGSIDVHVHATALRFPRGDRFDALTGEYGVDELFDDCTDAAWAFRRRADRSARRLKWTLAGAGGVVGAMAAGMMALFALSPQTEDRLVLRVRAYQDREGPAAVRLADRALERNRAELAAVRDDLGFDHLPADMREYVENRLKEFDDYKAYRDRFAPPRLGPADVRSLAELAALDAALASELAPPAEYAGAWADTPAERLWDKWRTDAGLLRQAENALYEWYRGLIRRGTVLTLGPALDANWARDVAGLVAEAQTPPFPRDARVPGSPAVAAHGGAALTYAPAFGSDRVEQAGFDWRETRDRVADLRDLADALGLTGSPRPAALELPEPPTPAASQPLAAERLSDLAAAYGRTPDTFAGWNTTRFPDPVRADLRRRLRRTFDAGVRHARGLVAGKPAAWLETDPYVRAWGRFLQLVARWADPDAPAEDPVAELAAFLKRDSFPADVRSLELTIPDDLRTQRVAPVGRLVVTHTPAGQPPRELAFRPDGDPQRLGAATVYRFAPDGHDGKVTFRPGDGVSATLPVRTGGQDFALDWTSGRSAVYQFERLTREPALRRPGGGPEPATGVRLAAVPETGLPAVPVLLPDVAPGR